MKFSSMFLAEVPEPEFFILLFVTGGAFAVGAAITYLVMRSLKNKNPSKLDRVAAFVPLGCGVVIFAPFAYLLFSWILYWTFPQHVVTHDEVVRQYRGTIYRTNEILELKEDGSFHQTVVAPFGHSYSQDGTWKLEGNYVVLDDYSMFYDNEHNKLFAHPALTSYVMYRYFYADKILVRDWDSDHYILKGQ